MEAFKFQTYSSQVSVASRKSRQRRGAESDRRLF